MEELNVKAYSRKLSAVYRLNMFKMTSLFRMASEEAAFIVAAVVPTDILTGEMQRLWKTRGNYNGEERWREEKWGTIMQTNEQAD